MTTGYLCERQLEDDPFDEDRSLQTGEFPISQQLLDARNLVHKRARILRSDFVDLLRRYEVFSFAAALTRSPIVNDLPVDATDDQCVESSLVVDLVCSKGTPDTLHCDRLYFVVITSGRGPASQPRKHELVNSRPDEHEEAFDGDRFAYSGSGDDRTIDAARCGETSEKEPCRLVGR